MAQPPDSHPSLPTNRAFVLQFRVNADGEKHFTGRVEHIASGQATRFQSLEELLAFVRRILQEKD